MSFTVACVLLSTVVMEHRFELGEESKKISTTTCNVLLLASLYFAVHLIHPFYNSTENGADDNDDSVALLQSALEMSKMVPMLCLLFQAAGMHALEQDPPAGQPAIHILVIMDVAAYTLF